MSDHEVKPTGCCDPFNPEPWQDKEIVWKEKRFVKDHVTSLFHIPLNMGGKIVKNLDLIEKAKAKAPYQLMLTDEKSSWGADIYIDVSKEVPGAEMATISGLKAGLTDGSGGDYYLKGPEYKKALPAGRYEILESFRSTQSIFYFPH
jgi:hypothetical protein